MIEASGAVHEEIPDLSVRNCNLSGTTPLSGTAGRDVEVAIWTDRLACSMTWG